MKHCFNSLRIALVCAFAYTALWATAPAARAQATSGPFAATHYASDGVTTLDSTSWSDTLSVPQFNASLGTLTAVTVTVNWQTYQAVTITDSGTTDQNVAADLSVAVYVELPSTNLLVGGPPNLEEGTYDSSGNNLTMVSMIPGQVISLGPVTTTSDSTNSPTVTLTDSADLATFTGTGSVPFPIYGVGTTGGMDDGGNITFSDSLAAGATISVVYTYTPIVVVNQGCIQGAVWNNKCGDGHCGHVNETGLGGGITINVYDANGKFVTSVVTAADGTYDVTGLQTGASYKVSVDTSTLPKGYALSCRKTTLCVTTPATGCAVGVDFAAVKQNKSCGYTTCSQQDWCSQNCLSQHYCDVYPCDKTCTVGCPNACYSFDCARSIQNCLPQSGDGCRLPNGCQNDPRYCNGSQLCGEVLACKLNCDYSDAGIFCSGFKNLVCQSGQFRNCTVEQVCKAGECCLSGQPLPGGLPPKCTPEDVCKCLHSINSCYSNTGGNNNRGTGFCK